MNIPMAMEGFFRIIKAWMARRQRVVESGKRISSDPLHLLPSVAAVPVCSVSNRPRLSSDRVCQLYTRVVNFVWIRGPQINPNYSICLSFLILNGKTNGVPYPTARGARTVCFQQGTTITTDISKQHTTKNKQQHDHHHQPQQPKPQPQSPTSSNNNNNSNHNLNLNHDPVPTVAQRTKTCTPTTGRAANDPPRLSNIVGHDAIELCSE